MTAPSPQSKPTAVEGSQPGTESLPERLRLNSCRRAHETPDEAATRRISTEMEAANRVEELTKALQLARKRIEYLGMFGASRHQEANETEFFPIIDKALAMSLEEEKSHG